MVLLTITSTTYESVPPGTYRTQFTAFTPTTTSKGKAYRWTFTVIEGEHKGKTISDLSDGEHPPTVKNKTGRWLVALSGKPLASGTSVDPDEYVGKTYFVICEPKENGGSKISTFSALPA
jgi:hypothetical protein